MQIVLRRLFTHLILLTFFMNCSATYIIPIWKKQFFKAVVKKISVKFWHRFYLYQYTIVFFAETGQATMHQQDVISHAVWKKRMVTAGGFPEWGVVFHWPKERGEKENKCMFTLLPMQYDLFLARTFLFSL